MSSLTASPSAGPEQVLRRRRRPRSFQPRRVGGRGGHHPRPVGVRQDHRIASVPASRMPVDRLRSMVAPCSGRGSRPSGATQSRHGLPGLRPVPPYDGCRERRLRPPRGDRASRVGEVLELVGLTGLEAGCRTSSPGANSSASPWPEPSPQSRGDPARRAFQQPGCQPPGPGAARAATILTEARTTAVFVTHDQEEALATSDIVAVMREGRVLQADTPGHLLEPGRPMGRRVPR